MKVYTRIVFDSAGNVLDEESFEHSGPVALCKGGGGGEVEETEEERALAEVAAKEWNWAQENIRPLMDAYIADIEATDADYSKARGEAGRAGHQAYSAVSDAYQKAQGRRGVNPNSGAWKGGMTAIAEDEAATVASGMTKAGYGVMQDQDRKKMGMLQYGSGKAATALEGVGREASEAASEAVSDARRSFEERGDWQQVAGTAAGVGARAYREPSRKSIGGRYGVRGTNLPDENIDAGTWGSPNF